ncbi:hypothetical protein FGG08_005858 [Glutinoglossum americanum]|uniref:DNA ligase n=1 Tax=Glutinoglossum americanum TaxID=1670608 RepID=A0A9P8HXM4_9PEZI|nr:hypothetical protein FGG08_005858 [Glutinoglossum americanum]
MASPTKKRKKNSDGAPPRVVRNLDYFFSKEKKSTLPGGDSKEQRLTDEELARKLHKQWNKEDMPLDHRPTDTMPAKEGNVESKEYALEEDTGPTTEPAPRVPPKSNLALQFVSSTEDAISSTIPFDGDALDFTPSKYVPELQKLWKNEGGDSSYALLTRCFALVNSTRSRIKIVNTLVNFLRTIIEGDPGSLLASVWLATNAISPPYISLELGLGGSAISKALKRVCGLDNQSLKTIYSKYGDAGDVAFEAKKKQSFTLRKPKPLSIKGVYQSLVRIANSKGTGSQEAKQQIVERLLQDARGGEESRYIVRTLVQHLRIGAVKTTMLIALSRAFLLSRPPGGQYLIRAQSELALFSKETLAGVFARAEEIVKACFARHPDYNDLVPCLLEVGVTNELLLRCGLRLHIPLRPMLGSITRDLSEMLTKLQERGFSCEYKYDGQRAQVHCDENGRVSIFSRHLELMTDKYPDLVALVPRIRGDGARSFIMEGEVVAIDRESGNLKNFQALAGRGRKDVLIGSVKVDVCLFAFDLMYLNGEELLGRPFRERRELLRSLFVEAPGQFTWVKSIDAHSADSEAILEFFNSAIEFKCEGIMVKVLDNVVDTVIEPAVETADDIQPRQPPPSTPKRNGKSKASIEKEKGKERGTRRKALLATYEPDKRLDSWLKVKKDYHTAADTLDLIPIAGWHGQGRKAKWWSPILLAVRNTDTGSLEAVCKAISGFTDKFYAEIKSKYDLDSDNVISRPAYIEYKGPEPDVWFEPQEVWEVVFGDITLSPVYTAAIGLVSEERGLSLRFPRFLRKRDDKGIEDASTAGFLAGLFHRQEAKSVEKSVANAGRSGDREEDSGDDE